MSSRNSPPYRNREKLLKKSAMAAALEMALHQIKRYPDLSIRKVCRDVSQVKGVPEETLRKRITRASAEQQKSHGLCALTLEEEGILVGMILAFDQLSNPLSSTQIRQIVLTGFQKEVSAAWVSRFLARNRSSLTQRSVKQIESARLDNQEPERIEDWIERHQKFMQRHHFPVWARFNCDETRIVPPTLTKRVVRKGRSKKNQRRSKAKCLGSLIPFVSAEGQVALSFYVIKDKDEANWKEVIPADERGRGTWKRRYAMTKSGSVNKILWEKIMLDFAKEWNVQHPGLHCIVYMDNCSVHRADTELEHIDANLVLKLAQLGVWVFFLPRNTTAWLQPLDDVCFGWFKRKLSQRHAQNCFSAAIQKEDGTIDLQDAYDAESTVFTPEKSMGKHWNE